MSTSIPQSFAAFASTSIEALPCARNAELLQNSSIENHAPIESRRTIQPAPE